LSCSRRVTRPAGMSLDDVQWVTLPESPNRAAAMAAGRIDATALEFADYLAIDGQNGKTYPVLGSFGETFPQAIASCFVVTEDYAAQNADLLRALIGMFPVQPVITQEMWDKMNEF